MEVESYVIFGDPPGVSNKVLWDEYPSPKRIEWLMKRGYKALWSKESYWTLPDYIRDRWESENE